jgi:hypothetical protein
VQLKNIRLLAAFCALPLSASLVTPAHAGTINTGAIECMVANGAQRDILHEYGAVGTDLRGASRIVSCSVPRSPFTSTPAPATGSFEVSAFIKTAGAAINCTLYSYDYTGVFLGSASFTLTSVTPFSRAVQQVSLPASQLGFWAYTSMSCVMPANAGAFLTGILSTF